MNAMAAGQANPHPAAVGSVESSEAETVSRRFGRRTTMGDIAAHLGVSRQLVSLVLRNEPVGATQETRDRVRRAAEELGYSPDVAAQMLRRKGSKYLGVLLNLDQASSVEIVERMHESASERGYKLVLAARSAFADEDAAVEELLGYRCEALITLSSPLSSTNLSRLSHRMPVVAVGYGKARADYDVVHSAGAHGIGLAVGHLVELGHRAISLVDCPSMPDEGLRRRGYLKLVKQHGLAPDILEVQEGYLEEAGSEAAALLLRRGSLPTAVVTTNDHVALGLIGSLSRSGVRVPDEVSVTGYDDSRIARLPFLDLTSVRQDPAEMGELAVECALTRVEGREQPRECVCEVSLRVRTTTAPPRR